MSRFRRHGRAEMGEAINFEDVLTVMMVLILLRLIFMVPLVNLDKAKTVSARGDAYWSVEAGFILSRAAQGGSDTAVAPYRAAFDLHGMAALLAKPPSPAAGGKGGLVWMEAATPDSNVFVLRHDLASGRFVALTVQGHGHSMSFRRGNLLWSQGESEWFAASDSLDYGALPESREMEKEFRAFTKANRGY